MDRLVTIALALATFFAKIGFELGKRQGRTELTEEQRRIALAFLEDFDRIANDGRGFDAAVGGLRNRAKVRDGGVSSPPPTNGKGG